MMKSGMTRLLAALCLWALLCALPAGLAEPSTGEAVDITRKCAFKVSEGSRDKLLKLCRMDEDSIVEKALEVAGRGRKEET